jgi:hypothetical protein
MTGHHHRLPRRGGEWRPAPDREGVLHRDGNPWDRVRLPPRGHRCVSQSKLVWMIATSPGNHVAAVRWCACGGLTYPGVDGRWLGKNMRRKYCGATFPAWHRAMSDLHGGPATVFARPRDLPQHADARETIVGSRTGRAAVEASVPPPPPAARPPHSVRARPASGHPSPGLRYVA